jgi:hypothetical protein
VAVGVQGYSDVLLLKVTEENTLSLVQRVVISPAANIACAPLQALRACPFQRLRLVLWGGHVAGRQHRMCAPASPACMSLSTSEVGPLGWSCCQLPTSHVRVVSHHRRVVSHHRRVVSHHPRFISHHPRFISHHPRFIPHHLRVISHHVRVVSHHALVISHHMRVVFHHMRFIVRCPCKPEHLNTLSLVQPVVMSPATNISCPPHDSGNVRHDYGNVYHVPLKI